MELFDDGFRFSDDKTLISQESVLRLLSKTYWASDRTAECLRRAIDHSVSYGVYAGDAQIGFARVVTDNATMFYIADVVIDEEYRGRGLGKKLVGFITGQDAYRNLTGMLLTNDAHGLYAQYGFTSESQKFMLRKRV